MAERRRDPQRDPWIDVPQDHDPDPLPEREDFERGVGLEGYDRNTRGEVVVRPGLKRPGDKEPVATPFES